MSRNGSGVYSLPAGNPVVTGTAISSTWANNTLNDIASAITGSLAADGQTSLTGNLNFGTNKASNLGDPTVAQDAVTLNYLTTQAVAFGGNITAPTQTTGNNTTRVSTTAFVQTALQLLYPVGSIYTSTVSTNPNTLFGFGTWVAFGSGKVLIGNGGGFTAGDTGGSADAIVVSHTHTATSTSASTTTITDPSHAHNINAVNGAEGSDNGLHFLNDSVAVTKTTNSASTGISAATATTTSTTNASAGASGTNANLQPYIVVYMWNRTA